LPVSCWGGGLDVSTAAHPEAGSIASTGHPGISIRAGRAPDLTQVGGLAAAGHSGVVETIGRVSHKAVSAAPLIKYLNKSQQIKFLRMKFNNCFV